MAAAMAAAVRGGSSRWVYDDDPEKRSAQAVRGNEALQQEVAAASNHHTTGIIGWKFLFNGLKRGGAEATALAVLEQVYNQHKQPLMLACTQPSKTG